MPSLAPAQYVPPNKRAATSAELLGGNMLIGGFTAATRALLAGDDPFRAFAIGSIGGAVVLAGKYLAVEPGTGMLGLATHSIGTSVVANAGRGVSPLDEITVPLPGVRFRFTPRAERKVRVALNAFELAVATQYAVRDGLAVDWGYTLATGALVFNATHRHVQFDETNVDGAATGPVALISAFADDPDRTARHEIVHVYQNWFTQEAWGRPIESYLRSRMPFGDRIPSWIEFGVGSPVLLLVEHWVVGRRGTILLEEAEAGLLERR